MSATPGFREKLYRGFQTQIVERWFLPRWMSDERLQEEARNGMRSKTFSQPRGDKPRAWFHAASVGELESLTPVILEWAALGNEIIVTVLSESAKPFIEKLKKELDALPGTLLYLGYSPWEGSWTEALKHARPAIFLTAKYEAWPELWVGLSRLEIPLLIVSAKARRSLRVAKSLCRVLGGDVPNMKLLAARLDDAEALKKLFDLPGVDVLPAGEPRWDRVQARAQRGNTRAQELIRVFGSLPRPWGVLGSVWPEDLELWRGRFAKGSGTLWVVPHRVDMQSLQRIEKMLSQAGLRVNRSSQIASEADGFKPGGSDCVLVDETGFLLELYSASDWVFVGGGFGVSMHSTIEPAIYGVPIACGPNGAEKFTEIAELSQTKQLWLVRSSEELDRWLGWIAGSSGDQRPRWKEDVVRRLGATRRIIEIMRDIVKGA